MKNVGKRVKNLAFVSAMLAAIATFGCDVEEAAWAGHNASLEQEDSIIDKETVSHVLKARQGKFRQCYVDATEADPGIHGRVVVNVALGSDGVEASVQESEIDNDRMLDCLKAAMESAPLPVSHRQVEFKVPLVFRRNAP
jgi:hypothetical protein